MFWGIDDFVIKTDIFLDFSILKLFLIKLSCYHMTPILSILHRFMFGKHNDFVNKARVSACMYFIVFALILSSTLYKNL